MPRLGVLEKLPLCGQLRDGDHAAGGIQLTAPMLTDAALKGLRSPKTHDYVVSIHAKTQLSSVQSAQKAAAPDRQLVGSRFQPPGRTSAKPMGP